MLYPSSCWLKLVVRMGVPLVQRNHPFIILSQRGFPVNTRTFLCACVCVCGCVRDRVKKWTEHESDIIVCLKMVSGILFT